MKLLFPVTLTLSAAASALAQAPDTATLGAVVISATRTPSSKSSLTQPVTVITGESLRARGMTRVSEALRLVPGAAIVQNGSIGSVNTLFLRGGESRYAKVLIDGVPVNEPGGFVDFSHLTTDNVERIEIVRGPASVVYGADAVSGIVQIFTRQGRGALNGSIDARGGNLGSRELSLDANGERGALRYSLGGGARRTDGTLRFNNNYYNGTLSGSAGVKARDGSDLLLTTRYTAAEFHYPTDFTGLPVDSNAYRVQHRLTVGLDGRSPISEKATAQLRVGTNEVSDLTEDIYEARTLAEDNAQMLHTALLSRHKRRSAEVGVTFSLPATTTLNIGAAYEHESERSVNAEGAVNRPASPTSTFDASRHNVGLYSELIRSTPAGGSMTLSVRRDDNSDYAAFTTYRAGFSRPLGSSSRIRASMNTAFNAPAFDQTRPTLYTVGSPHLKPERTRSWELGLEQSLVNGILRGSVNYFRQRFSDMIQYVSGGPPSYRGSYANLSEAQSNGYEVELNLTPPGPWSASASFTVAEPRVNKVSAEYSGDLSAGDALIRRPTHSGNASLTWSVPRSSSLSVLASFAGKRPDLDFTQFPARTVTLPAYTKLDLAGSHTIWQNASARSAVSLTAHLDNATGRKYQDVLNFPAPRRTWLLGARYEGAM